MLGPPYLHWETAYGHRNYRQGILTTSYAQWPCDMVLGQKYELLASHALELRAVNYLCKILGGAPHSSLVSEVGEEEEEGCCTPSLLPSRRRLHSHRHVLSLKTPVGSLGWGCPLCPTQVGTVSAGPCCRGSSAAPCFLHVCTLSAGTWQAVSLCLPFFPSFLLLSGFLLFMSPVKSQFIHLRVTVFSLSQPSFISEPLPSFFCLTWSICESLSYPP